MHSLWDPQFGTRLTLWVLRPDEFYSKEHDQHQGGGMERLASFSSKCHQINQLPHLGVNNLDGTRISWRGGILGSPSLKAFLKCANVALWGRG